MHPPMQSTRATQSWTDANFLAKYDSTTGGSVVKRLNCMIGAFERSLKDWRYYFVKYGPFTNNALLPLNLLLGQGKEWTIKASEIQEATIPFLTI